MDRGLCMAAGVTPRRDGDGMGEAGFEDAAARATALVQTLRDEGRSADADDLVSRIAFCRSLIDDVLDEVP